MSEKKARKPRATPERMPWPAAVDRFGEPALKEGHSYQRVSNWRRDGVPGDVVSRLFRAEERGVTDQSTRLVDAAKTIANMPPPILKMVGQVQQIWTHTNEGQGIGWAILETVVGLLARRPLL